MNSTPTYCSPREYRCWCGVTLHSNFNWNSNIIFHLKCTYKCTVTAPNTHICVQNDQSTFEEKQQKKNKQTEQLEYVWIFSCTIFDTMLFNRCVHRKREKKGERNQILFTDIVRCQIQKIDCRNKQKATEFERGTVYIVHIGRTSTV